MHFSMGWRAASAFVIALAACAANADVVWRINGGTTSMNFFEGMLKDQGVQVVGMRQTSRDTAPMEGAVGFEIKPGSDMRVTTIRRILELVNGSVSNRGGFALKIGKSVYSAYEFTVSPRGTVPTQGFTLRGSDGSPNAVVLDLTHVQGFVNPTDWLIAFANMDVSINAQWARAIGRPQLAGALVGGLSIVGKVEWVSGKEDPPVDNGGGDTKDVGLSAMSSLTSLGRDGTFPDGVSGLSMSTTSCNYGNENIPWFSPMAQNHPVICMNVYRILNGRFEQIGEGWLKHGFFATNSSGCGSCQNPGTGELLGPGCSDTYGTGNNGDRFYLGPRNEVNPFTGIWTCTGSWFANFQPDCNRRNGSGSFTPSEHRIIVRDADLNVTGAQFYYEAYYISGGEVNKYNQIGFRQASATWNSSLIRWDFSTLTAMTMGPAINVYGDMRGTAEPRTEGDAILAVKTTDLGGGNFRYDYALYVHDLDRQIREFSVPVAAGVNVSNVGFRDADQDSTNQWTSTLANNKLTWSTQTFAQNPNANSLKYGHVFNFWFDANSAPVSSCANCGLFKPGTLNLISAITRGPSIGETLPASVTIISGNGGGGNLQSLNARDGNRFLVNIINDVVDTDATIEIASTSPCLNPSVLRMNLTTQTDRPPSTQRVLFWNYQTSAWEQVDLRAAPTTETQIQVVISTNAGRFVGPNQQIRARIRQSLINDVILSRVWNTWFDQAVWQITP